MKLNEKEIYLVACMIALIRELPVGADELLDCDIDVYNDFCDKIERKR